MVRGTYRERGDTARKSPFAPYKTRSANSILKLKIFGREIARCTARWGGFHAQNERNVSYARQKYVGRSATRKHEGHRTDGQRPERPFGGEM